MNKQTNIANELKQIAPDVNWPASVPFTVPVGYFDQLPAAILLQIQLQELRSSLPARVAHSIPSGYFDELPATIMQRIKNETAEATNNIITNPVAAELASLSPFLANMPRQTPFTVPDGYFESLPIASPTQAIPLRVAYRNNKITAWIKWSVAACLITFIGGSALLFIVNDKNNHRNNIERQLEGLEEQDIVDYLQTHTDPFDNDAFLTASYTIDAAPVQSQLNEAVPLEAIEKYLQQTDLSKEVLPEKK
ncbi:hypothetical protein ACDQ55_01495 [Chitinophaga sp. 30R24]|uniref:hypothetical protein n=1 Tax=Chitinophaga sp. 30R24 TaxID=3248838 RepID=UPI003B90DD21